MQPNNGICHQIQAAQSVEEVSALLAKLETYKYASKKTRNRATKLAASATRRLRSKPYTKLSDA